MAAADCSGRRQFVVACGVLSRCVKAEAAPPRPAVQAAASTMLLMPGADVAPDVREEIEATPAQAQFTIIYGGRVLVFDDVPVDRAAELVRVAARQNRPGGVTDVPVARKASLPYATARLEAPSVASNKGKREVDAGCWLGLGIPGGCAS